jgi:hypothetical protein
MKARQVVGPALLLVALLGSALGAPQWALAADSSLISQRALGRIAKVTLEFAKPFPSGIMDEHGNECRGVHAGVDFKASKGETVRSITTGSVLRVAPDIGFVFVYDGNNTIIYGHLDSVSVKEGDPVIEGQFIGKAGSKGIGTGNPHLHLEVTKGRNANARSCQASADEIQKKNIDPIAYLTEYVRRPSDSGLSVTIDGGKTSTTKQKMHFRINGSGFTSRAQVTLYIRFPFGEIVTRRLRANSKGEVRGTFALTCRTPPGEYQFWLEASGTRSNTVLGTVEKSPKCK